MLPAPKNPLPPAPDSLTLPPLPPAGIPRAWRGGRKSAQRNEKPATLPSDKNTREGCPGRTGGPRPSADLESPSQVGIFGSQSGAKRTGGGALEGTEYRQASGATDWATTPRDREAGAGRNLPELWASARGVPRQCGRLKWGESMGIGLPGTPLSEKGGARCWSTPRLFVLRRIEGVGKAEVPLLTGGNPPLRSGRADLSNSADWSSMLNLSIQQRLEQREN